MLVALVQKKGRVVTRDELINRCWNGRFVGDDVINRAISVLRPFLDRAGEFTIETVPRVGYRLLRRKRRPPRAALVGGAIALLLGAGWLVETFASTGGDKQDPPVLRVELLPFETSTHDALTQAAAFAAHDSVSHALAQTRFALVQPSSGARQQPRADLILSADVSSSPDAVIATVRMEQAADHVVVYSKQFSVSRAESWRLAEIIGPQVAGALGWTEPMLLAQQQYPSDPAIVADLLQKAEVDQISWLSDYERARRDAKSSPNSAVAQLALAFSTAFNLPNLPREQLPQAVATGRAAAARAEQLAPKFGDSYIPWCLLHSRSRMVECQDRLRAAMELDPNSPWVDYTLADRLKDGGRFREALRLAQHSLAADDFNPTKIALTLRLLEATGDTARAEQLFTQAHRWWPGSQMIFWDRLYGILARGDFAELMRFRDDLRGDPMFKAVEFGSEPIPQLVAAVTSRNIAAVRRICPVVQQGSFRRDLCMIAFARTGDKDDAFALAFQIFPQRVGRSAADEERLWLDSPFWTDTDIIVGAGAASLRSDRRFLDLTGRLGIAAYWRSGYPPDFCQPPHTEPVCSAVKT